MRSTRLLVEVHKSQFWVKFAWRYLWMIPYTINFCDENSNPVAFEALSRSLLVKLEPVDAQIEIGDERAVYVGLGR